MKRDRNIAFAIINALRLKWSIGTPAMLGETDWDEASENEMIEEILPILTNPELKQILTPCKYCSEIAELSSDPFGTRIVHYCNDMPDSAVSTVSTRTRGRMTPHDQNKNMNETIDRWNKAQES